MSRTYLSASAIGVAIAALLSACGGGEPVDARQHPFALAASASPAVGNAATVMAPDARRRALGAPTGTITIDQLLAWAEDTYPELFPRGPASQRLTAGGVNYTLRYYPKTNNYAGVSDDGNVYALGAFTDNVIKGYGKMTDFTCTVSPGLCVDPPPTTASMNQCVDPAMSSLPTGATIKIVFTYTGLISGEQTVESKIMGPGTFEGQSAVLAKSTTTGSNSVQGISMTMTNLVDSYQQVGTGGLIKTLGSNITNQTSTAAVTIGGVTIPGQVMSDVKTKSVFNPPLTNIEFTLAVGGSVTKATTVTTTPISPAGAAITAPISDVHTFEAVESINVLGKSYNTCRYAITSGDGTSKVWYIVGKGVPVKTEASYKDGKTQLIEAKSIVYNGQAL